MSKRNTRRKKAKMIQAFQPVSNKSFACDAESIEWIRASDDGVADAPKRFKMRAYTGGPMQVGYYGSPVVIDMSGLVAKAPIPILMNHSMDKLVGHADEITVGSSALDLAGVVSGASPEADQVLASSKNGFPWKASVGVRPDKMEFVGEGITTQVNGKTLTGPLYVARKSTLGEVSFVAMAADSKTTVKVAASSACYSRKEIDMDFDQWVQALFCGEVPELRDDQRAKLQAKYDAEKKTVATKIIEGKAATVEPPKFDLSACILAHQKHVANIEAKVASYKGKIIDADLSKIQADACTKAAELKAQALNEEWPEARLEVALIKAQADAEVSLIRAERPKAPAIHASTHDAKPEVIEAAFCMAAGLRDVENAYKPEVLEAASAFRRREGVSLQGLILAAAFENGYTGAYRIHRGNCEQVMRAAFIHAAASTHSLTTMLSTVGNKFLLQGFGSVEQVYREFAATRSVNDFKQVTSYRMLDDMVFEEIGPDGEIKHGKASQESYTNQAKTYAKMFALTRQDIINDDLGAFDTIRNRIGRGSGIKLNQVFWAKFLDDSAFFTEARKNLITTTLGESGISAAEVALASQTDGYGNPIDVGGDYLLLTGATLSPTAKKWYVSAEIRDTTASTKTPTTNIYQNKYRPVMSRYVTDTTDWYLLPTSGSDMEPMEICYLDGVQSPTIESADVDFDMLGVQFRGYFDFGVNQKEWRASVKSAVTGGT